MKVFVMNNNLLSERKEIHGKKVDLNEKLIQTLIEKNLGIVFPSLEFLTTEYQIDGLRPDSIAFDNDTKSFVIIEYKNVKHKGVVDQGMSYYKLLQEKKENFVLLYHKIKNIVLDTEKDINWDETRVIFISPEYTEHQKRASQSVDLPIELYTITKFETGIVLLNKIENKPSSQLKNKMKPLIRLDEYSEKDYLEGKYFDNRTPKESAKKLFVQLKNRISDTFQNVEFKQRKKYAGFYSKKDGSAVCTIEIFTTKLNIVYSTSKQGVIPLDSFVQDYSKKGHWGVGNYLSEIKNESDIEKAIPLIAKVYQLKA
jgi:predicted transport protein